MKVQLPQVKLKWKKIAEEGNIMRSSGAIWLSGASWSHQYNSGDSAAKCMVWGGSKKSPPL